MVSKKNGFTLVEMMATLAIISILATGILPLSQVVYQRTKELELRNHLRIIRTALDEHKILVEQKIIPGSFSATGYPKTLESLVNGIDLKTSTGEIKKFLRRIPKDPMTDDGQWGLRSYTDAPESNVWGGQDVYDIYSLSDKQALDGTYYKNW